MADIKAEIYDDYKVIAKILMLKGEKGNGIKSIVTNESAESGGTNTVTITMTDGTTYTFGIKNGKDYTDLEHEKLVSYINMALSEFAYKVMKQEITVTDTSKTSFTFDFDLKSSSSVNVSIYWDGLLLTESVDYTLGSDGRTINISGNEESLAVWDRFAKDSTLTAVKEYLVG